MTETKLRKLGWMVMAMTEFTPGEMAEVGIKAEHPVVGLLLDEGVILLPVMRRDGEIFAGEFGTLQLTPEDATIGVICFEPPPALDWVDGPREDC